MTDSATLRAWWWRRQALDGRLEGSSAGRVLEETGWARSVGGVGPYVTLFARGGLRRETVDTAVSNLDVHELPSARGCTYVVPKSDYALALRVGEAFGGGDMKIAARLGVTNKQVEKLGDAVVRALEGGPLGPEQIRTAAAGAVRSLGPEGVKRGIASTLPLALGQLQTTGRIRRIPIDGRLDKQRYRYTLWQPNPLDSYMATREEAYTDLARRYFRWTGPATAAEFQWFSGLGVKAARMALEPLGLVQLSEGDARLLFPQDRDALLSFQPPREPCYMLVSSLDGIALLRRDLKSLLDPKDAGRSVLGKGELAELESHAILDRGRVVGLWEYDTEAEEIAWCSFIPVNRELRAAVERTEEYVRADLGDARSFSLDSPKSRKPRIEAIRRAVKS